MHKLNKHANLSQETCFMTNLQAKTLEILLVVGPKKLQLQSTQRLIPTTASLASGYLFNHR